MRTDTAISVFSEQAARMELPTAVPQQVRDQFAKVQRMYAGGVFTYDNFTACVREAYRVLEVALKVRFAERYATGVPILTRDGREEVEDLDRFLELPPRARHVLRGHPHFNGSLSAHMRWARSEGLLYGERNRVRERLTIAIRNDELHDVHDRTRMPPDARYALCAAGEMIAILWGAAMPTKLWYPGTVEREVMVFGQGPKEHESIRFLLEQLSEVPEDDETDLRSWFVLRVAFEQDLFFWDPQFQLTGTPVEILWGPASWGDLLQVAEAHGAVADHATFVDRLFFVRQVGGEYELPRNAEQARRTQEVMGERWLVVRADSPSDVIEHLRRVRAGTCAPRPCNCPLTVLYEPSRRARVLRFAKRHVPRRVPVE